MSAVVVPSSVLCVRCGWAMYMNKPVAGVHTVDYVVAEGANDDCECGGKKYKYPLLRLEPLGDE